MSFFKKILSSLSGDVSGVPTATTQSTLGRLDELQDAVDESPNVRLTNLILLQAFDSGATEITLSPKAETFQVSYLIAGEHIDIMSPPLRTFESVLDCLAELAQTQTSVLRTTASSRQAFVERSGQTWPIEIQVRGDKATIKLGLLNTTT